MIAEVFMLLTAAVVLGASVFWVLMIIECATKDRPDHCLHQCSWSRLPANRRGAIRANATPLNAPTVSNTFDDPWHFSR